MGEERGTCKEGSQLQAQQTGGLPKRPPGKKCQGRGTAPRYSLPFVIPVRRSGHPVHKVRDTHRYGTSARQLRTLAQEVADKGSASSSPVWCSVHKSQMHRKSHDHRCRRCSVHRERTFQLTSAWKAEVIMRLLFHLPVKEEGTCSPPAPMAVHILFTGGKYLGKPLRSLGNQQAIIKLRLFS